ncbi:30S ribosome-binding factor RbfA [Atopobacter phocae]|uniref:30S ribosome-binding factor RbfA n=1 Tax=Atopobacter phocae TaxID=136492 RepID=UPI000472D003|nr:30S ribosome-binding factor RbfA [Atopobacter phocae]
MAKHRVGRVRQEILKEVNSIIANRVRDPRVKDVTLTDIELSNDLQYATLYYSTLSDSQKEREETELGLNKAKGLIRSELATRLTLYKVPELKFERDSSVDYGSRIDQLIAQLHKQD